MQRFGGRTVNVVAMFSLRSGLPVYPISRGTVLAVRTVGRRTGRRRTTPMGFVEIDGHLLVVSEHGTRSDWYRNAKKAGRVRVLYRGRWHKATLQVTDRDPGATLARMPSRMIAGFNRLLWHRPRVVEVRLEDR